MKRFNEGPLHIRPSCLEGGLCYQLINSFPADRGLICGWCYTPFEKPGQTLQ